MQRLLVLGLAVTSLCSMSAQAPATKTPLDWDKLQVEILELSPEGSASFETGGSHRGFLSEDLQRIDAQWITTANGRRGQLHLRAASFLACSPAEGA